MHCTVCAHYTTNTYHFRKLSRYTHFPTIKLRSNLSGSTNKKVCLKGQLPSKSKNRVWIASGTETSDIEPTCTARSTRLSLASPFCGMLAGHETKTRQGNKQWVANRQLQLAQQSLRKAALLSSAKRASFVSLQRGKYMLDSSGKRLKKVDSTVTMAAPSNTVKYHVTMEASVKRIRARYICLVMVVTLCLLY